MKFATKLLFLALLGFSGLVQAQAEPETWDLRTCVEHALKNNLQVRQAELSIEQARLGEKQAKFAIYPTVNGSFRHGGNFGRSIDFTSYQFVNQATHSSQVSLSVGQPIYQGMQLRNRIRQSGIDLQASQQDAEQIKDNIALSVAQAYLSILLAEEQLVVLKEQAKVTEAQLSQTLKLINAGSLPDNSRFDLEAQIARNDQGIVVAENGVALAYVSLKMLLNIDVAKEIKVVPIEVQIPEEAKAWTLDEVYGESVANMPNVIAARMRERSAELGVSIAKGALQPSVSAYGSLTTNFSSAARDRDGFDTVMTNINLSIFGFNVPVGFPTTVPRQGDVTPYFKQLWNNLYTNVGMSVNFPIFNGMQTRIAIQRAELGVKIAQLNTKQTQNQLKSDIQRALTDVLGAEKALRAAEKSLLATRASVENTQKRFNLGVVNGFEYISAQNMLLSTESSLLQAKYDYVFKLKVLDFYRGQLIE